MEKQFELTWINGIKQGTGYKEKWSYSKLKGDFLDHDVWKTIKYLEKKRSCLYVEDCGFILMITRL